MSRLAWIHANLWPRAVSAAQARRTAGQAPEGAVEQALAAGAENDAWALVQGYDPTPGHEALAWLLRRWTAGAIRGEDLGKARDSIQVWSKTKQRLPVGARDLGRYKTLAEIDRVLMDAGIDFDATTQNTTVTYPQDFDGSLIETHLNTNRVPTTYEQFLNHSSRAALDRLRSRKLKRSTR